ERAALERRLVQPLLPAHAAGGLAPQVEGAPPVVPPAPPVAPVHHRDPALVALAGEPHAQGLAGGTAGGLEQDRLVRAARQEVLVVGPDLVLPQDREPGVVVHAADVAALDAELAPARAVVRDAFPAVVEQGLELAPLERQDLVGRQPLGVFVLAQVAQGAAPHQPGLVGRVEDGPEHRFVQPAHADASSGARRLAHSSRRAPGTSLAPANLPYSSCICSTSDRVQQPRSSVANPWTSARTTPPASRPGSGASACATG